MLEEFSEVGLSGSRRGFVAPIPQLSQSFSEILPMNETPVLISSDLLIEKQFDKSQIKSKKLRSPYVLGNLQQDHQAPVPRLSVGEEARASPIRVFEKKEHHQSQSSRSISIDRFQPSVNQEPIAFMRKMAPPPAPNPLRQVYYEGRSTGSRDNIVPIANYNHQCQHPQQENANLLNESLIHPVSDDSSVLDDSRINFNVPRLNTEQYQFTNHQNPVQYPQAVSTMSSRSSRRFIDRETSKMIMDMSQGKLIPANPEPSSYQRTPHQVETRNQMFRGAETNSYHPSTSRHSALDFMGVNPEPLRITVQNQEGINKRNENIGKNLSTRA